MNGIIIINKEKGYTSRDVVNIVSKKFHTKKVGHTGTLDPMATGVLVVCINEGTKLVELLTSKDKEYIAEITLGLNTDTLDITGQIIEEKESIINKNDIINCLNKFPKKYIQEVPLYSAVKINGKKMYEYARNNEIIDLPKRKVEINSLELVDDIIYKDNKTIFKIKCLVSKGTYIRSLVRDIALSLNTIGTMSDLIRTKNGIFKIEDTISIDELKNNECKIISIEETLKDIDKIELNDNLIKKITNGAKIKNTYNKNIVAFTKNQKIIAIYINDNDLLKPYKMFLNNI